MNMAIGMGLGVIGGIGLVLMRRKPGFVRVPAEARLPDVPLLGVVPSAADPWALGHSGRRLIGARPKSELGLVTWDRDTSLLSESFRAALTSILFTAGLNGGPRKQSQWEDSRVVVVTSIDMMEGKSTVLSNLGIALAETKRRALLIDADLRRPRLHEIFNICNDWGLTDLLQSSASASPMDEAPLETLARRTHIPDLWILPSGPGSAAISGLLHSVDLSAMMHRFRREFDLVLIDTPPMGLYPDARILGRASDGVVIVVRANKRSREELETAYITLVQDQIPLLGTILNDWKMDPGQTRAYGRRYGDYRHRGDK